MISNKSTTSVGMVTARRFSLAGWLLAAAKHEKPGDRFVTAQGLAERTIMANKALWTLRLQAHGEDQRAAENTLSRMIRAAEKFLIGHGLRPSDWIVLSQTSFNKNTSQMRAACTIRVDTPAVWAVAAAYEDLATLKATGVGLMRRSAPTYHLTDIHIIAAELMWEASSKARESAERHAIEASARLIGLKRAEQSGVRILPAEPDSKVAEAHQLNKKLRVVSTLEFRMAA